MGVMGFLSIVVSFLMRGCLSIAITEMVLPLNSTAGNNESINTQPIEDLSTVSRSSLKELFVSSSFCAHVRCRETP